MQIKSLLLVDDDADDHEIFGIALKKTLPSIDFSTAGHGGEALQKLDSGEVRPDIIFLDINMPVMNGFHTLRKLKEDSRFQHIPVVIYSTSIQPQEEQQAIALGALQCVKKPSALDELCRFLSVFLQSQGN
jgi:CheY-like chemotaxis protein